MPGLSNDELEALLDWEPGSQCLRAVPGRETFLWPPDQACYVVKRFEGSLAGERWYQRLKQLGRESPARLEYDNLADLSRPEFGARGLVVPTPLACFQRGNRSLVVMERVAYRATLREALGQLPGAWAGHRRGLLSLVLALHGLQGGKRRHHRDLYLQHILIRDPEEDLCLIDLGRVRAAPRLRRRWLEKDLAALHHSCPQSVSELQRLAWLDAYLRRLGGVLSREQARARLWRWARAIEARRARMAQHTPKYGE